MFSEKEQDVWAGDLIGIKKVTSFEGDYLIEVPKVAYEEIVENAQAWVDTVLAETALDTEGTLKRIDESIATLVSERVSHEQRIGEIIAEIRILEAKKAELVTAAKEAEWVKPVRNILMPHAKELRKMVRYLGREVMEVGLNSTGTMTHSLSEVDGEDALTELD